MVDAEGNEITHEFIVNVEEQWKNYMDDVKVKALIVNNYKKVFENFIINLLENSKEVKEVKKIKKIKK